MVGWRTFQGEPLKPPNPKAGFDGIVVRCQVLDCEPPSRLACSWPAGPIVDMQASYLFQADGASKTIIGGVRVTTAS